MIILMEPSLNAIPHMIQMPISPVYPLKLIEIYWIIMAGQKMKDEW